MKLTVVTGLTLLLSSMPRAVVAQSQFNLSSIDYAERLYNTYQEGSGGSVAFSVATAGTGRLSELVGKPFNALVPTPDFRIESTQQGTKLTDVHFIVPEDSTYAQDNASNSVDQFQQHGLMVADATYRKLVITTTIGTAVRTHQALEMCWTATRHCAVYDPAVVFLQSKAESRMELLAEGWGPKTALAADPFLVVSPNAKHCGLASNPSWIGETITWKAWTAKYKDVFGITLVTKHLGEQQYGLTCDTSCHPHPFSRSDSSSGSGTGGWNVACDNTGDAVGKTGNTSRSIAETKCTHKWVAHASASVDIKGSGASISASWSLGGGVDSNGGVLTNSCGYF